MNPTRSTSVKYQFDSGCPIMQSAVQYVVLSEQETEIVFPNGERKTFMNWDVKGVRESFYISDILQKDVPAEEYSPIRSNEPMDSGIKPSDVSRFVATLAEKPQYERLFDSSTATVVEPPAPEPVAAAPVPEPKPVKERKVTGRKFPYDEVARLWDDGLTIKQIATAIGYLDPKKDCTHTVRTFLTKMHAGYLNSEGQRVVLPYREKAKKAVAGA